MRADRVMAERATRIDLGAPLRSPARLPYHKPDLNSGPVCHPGAVPFVWEQSPGRPKSVRTRRPSLAPSSPSQPRRPSENGGDGGATPYHNALGERDRAPLHPIPAALPDNGANAEPAVKEPKAPARPEALSVADVLRGQDADDAGLGEDDERFSDALDTLSRTESFTVNCSVSGLSGVPDDRPAGAAAAATEPGGARGFMMDRFLPAAQAVAVGSPQYTFRKAGAAGNNSAREHAHAAAANWRMPNGDDDRARRTPVQLPYQHLPPNYLSCNYPRRGERGDEQEEDDDDDDDDVHSTRGFASKGCGLLPGLCVKTSLLLMNPMPKMKNGKVRGGGRGRGLPTKGNAPSPLARTSQNKNLGSDSNGRYWEEVYKHKLEQKYIHQGEDRRSKMTSESNHMTFWSDPQTGYGSSPFHHSIGDGIGVSPNRRDVASSPSPKASGSFGVRDRDEKMSRSNGSSSVGIDHDHSSFVGSDHSSSLKGSSSMSSGVEKTSHEDSMDHRTGIDSETKDLTLILDPNTSLNSGYDVQLGGRPMVRSNSIVRVQDDDPSTERMIEVPEPAVLMPSQNAGSVKLDDLKTSTHDTSQNVPLCLEKNITAVKKESSPLQCLLPLPVPKSPSDSWLSRNLPSVKNKPPTPSFLGIQVQPKKQSPWASTQPKENNLKPPRPRQIRFADVVERPNYLDTEI